MDFRGRKISPFFISVAIVITVTVIICLLVPFCSGGKITFETTYYFVCYSVRDNAVSASSVSDAVSSYGGAGYILEMDDSFYVTVSCYYKRTDAESVCESLKKRDLNCFVLEVETSDYSVGFSSTAETELYKGNLNTLNSLSQIAFVCANSLDLGECSQNGAKSVISDVKNGLKALLNANADNCFSKELRRLITVCQDLDEGYIYSKDLRKLQIAIADTVINVKIV